MKQLFLFAGAMALAGGMLFTSCKDNTEEQPGTVPEVSISADETFASDYTATVTLTLSSASSSDVVVNLADADVESGQSEVPAVYSKSVTIGAGKTSATVKVSADVLGLTVPISGRDAYAPMLLAASRKNRRFMAGLEGLLDDMHIG